MIAADVHEQDYRIGHSFAEFWTPGEYGPLTCGCCLVVVGFDPCGPSMCLVMVRRDSETHEHAAEDFARLLTR